MESLIILGQKSYLNILTQMYNTHTCRNRGAGGYFRKWGGGRYIAHFFPTFLDLIFKHMLGMLLHMTLNNCTILHIHKDQTCQLSLLGWRLQHFRLISSINLPKVYISFMESPAFCAQLLIHTSTESILHLWRISLILMARGWQL